MEEEQFIFNTSIPPENVETFYIIDTINKNYPPYIYQLDAFEIANHYSIKTINGYSGKFPQGWDGIWDVTSDSMNQAFMIG